VIPVISGFAGLVKRIKRTTYNRHYVNLNRSKYRYIGVLSGCETIHKQGNFENIMNNVAGYSPIYL